MSLVNWCSSAAVLVIVVAGFATTGSPFKHRLERLDVQRIDGISAIFRHVRDYARDVLRLSYVVSAILPQNARSRRVVERFGVQAEGQMEVVGLTFDRYVWPLAADGTTRPRPASMRPAAPE